MMHNSCINYPNELKLCRENHATGKLNFAEQKTELLLHTDTHFSNASHVIQRCFLNWSAFIYILTELLSCPVPEVVCKKVSLQFDHV